MYYDGGSGVRLSKRIEHQRPNGTATDGNLARPLNSAKGEFHDVYFRQYLNR